MVLEARQLRKTFSLGDSPLEVLRGVDLAIEPGQSVAIRGESGSGKTTLLHVLAGLENADEGTLLWEGSDVTRLDAAAFARRRTGFLGMVFQSIHLFPELHALDNILIARRLAGPVRSEDTQRAKELLARVGLASRETQMPAKLSGGERQRVAVARALMNRPRLLLADEPTGNLDERTGAGVMDLLLGLCAELGTALVLVTHNAEHAARCQRQLTLTLGAFREAAAAEPVRAS